VGLMQNHVGAPLPGSVGGAGSVLPERSPSICYVECPGGGPFLLSKTRAGTRHITHAPTGGGAPSTTGKSHVWLWTPTRITVEDGRERGGSGHSGRLARAMAWGCSPPTRQMAAVAAHHRGGVSASRAGAYSAADIRKPSTPRTRLPQRTKGEEGSGGDACEEEGADEASLEGDAFSSHSSFPWRRKRRPPGGLCSSAGFDATPAPTTSRQTPSPPSPLARQIDGRADARSTSGGPETTKDGEIGNGATRLVVHTQATGPCLRGRAPGGGRGDRRRGGTARTRPPSPGPCMATNGDTQEWIESKTAVEAEEGGIERLDRSRCKGRRAGRQAERVGVEWASWESGS
jgi:hypothetical protein